MTNKTAFVLMPFAEDFTDVYQYLIKEGLESAGYIVKRADDIKSQKNILSDIIEGIVSSDLIVTDLTGANPNVYYELGIAHALDKNVILLTQAIGELPFDLRSYRVISYDVHFSKMNQAKIELSDLAIKAYTNSLPFGNPVKDFIGTNLETKNQSLAPPFDRNDTTGILRDEWGLLDYSVDLEDGFSEMGNIITEVGERMENELTPEMTKSGDKLNSGKYSTKQKRDIIKEYSVHMQKYGAFLKGRNKDYKDLLSKIESGLEFILGGNVEVESEEDLEGLEELMSVFESLEASGTQGRDGFINLIETMESVPKLEKNFNRAKVFMITELNDFVGNIDQTISIVSRAGRLGKSLLKNKT